MKRTRFLSHFKTVIFVLGITLSMLAGALRAQEKSTGFSFAVYGDSRSMMYLPYKQSEEAEARQLMVDMRLRSKT
jgi:hypothetical protein